MHSVYKFGFYSRQLLQEQLFAYDSMDLSGVLGPVSMSRLKRLAFPRPAILTLEMRSEMLANMNLHFICMAILMCHPHEIGHAQGNCQQLPHALNYGC